MIWGWLVAHIYDQNELRIFTGSPSVIMRLLFDIIVDFTERHQIQNSRGLCNYKIDLVLCAAQILEYYGNICCFVALRDTNIIL